VAIGTSAAAVAVNALINLIGHGRGGRVKWPCATVFAAAGLAGSFAGSGLAKQVDGQRLLHHRLPIERLRLPRQHRG